ncbi:hypothetical protein BKA93DRAFT_805712 [Sparassis latifolia]
MSSTTAWTARPIIPAGIYYIRPRGSSTLCLQLNVDDFSITAAQGPESTNTAQQWKVEYVDIDHTYKFTNCNKNLEMGITKEVPHVRGSIRGVGEEWKWLLTSYWNGFLIGDTSNPYVLDLDDDNKDVVLNYYSPLKRLDRQVWVLDLVEGTAPEVTIIPGRSYRLINLADTTYRLGITYLNSAYRLCLKYGGDSTDSTWLLCFNSETGLVIACSYPSAPPSRLNYVTNDTAITNSAIVCRLIPDDDTNGVFYINPNSGATGQVLTSRTPLAYNSAVTVVDPVKDDNKQKWRLELCG